MNAPKHTMVGGCSHSLQCTDFASQFKILYCNARSLIPKIDALHAEVILENPDIICIVETWLSDEVNDTEIQIPGYSIIRKDRNRHGGGVCVYISHAVTSISHLPLHRQELECIFLRVTKDSTKLTVGCFYRPPSSSFCTLDMLADSIFLLNPTYLTDFVLIGDFNVNSEHGYCSKLKDFMATFCLTQVVDSPTRIASSGTKSRIDLCFVSNIQNLLSCVTKPPLSTSDHDSIIVTLECGHQVTEKQCSSRTSVWKYSNADVLKAECLIKNINWSSLLSDDIDTTWKNWKCAFLKVIEESVPKVEYSCHRTLPWITNRIIHSIKRRNKAFHKYKKTKQAYHWQQYKHMRNSVVKQIRTAKAQFFKTISERAKDPHMFWHIMNSLKLPSANHVPELHCRDESTLAKTDFEKAETLNNYFSECFNTLVPPLSCSNSQQEHFSFSEMSQIDISVEETQHMLSSLTPRKAPGIDNITADMLRLLSTLIAPSVTLLFNHILQLGQLPREWKTSVIVPIPKNKDKHLLSCYRPISLLPIISKVLERHIVNILKDHISEKCPISLNQWGFCAMKSTSMALASTVHGWVSSLQSGFDVCTVFFDLKKAFDSVPHQHLLEKLTKLELPPPLLQWLRDYLTSRFQQVNIASTASTLHPVLSGVPQGSILGPLLFIFYIDDINSVKLSEQASLTLYADDICYTHPVTAKDTFEGIQQDIDKIVSWSAKNKLTFNESKTVWMLLTKKRLHHFTSVDLHLNGKKIVRVNEVRYLGVLITADLTWSAHIESVVQKAKRRLGYVYRTFYKNCSTEVLLNLYKSLIRPMLEYCCLVWDPSSKILINTLEGTQKLAAKICSKDWNSPYACLLEKLGLPTLQSRRSYIKLCTVYKILSEESYFPSGFFTYRNSAVNTRSYNPLHLSTYNCTTTYFMTSFVPHSISLWNSLPSAVTSSPTLASFKYALCYVLF